MINWSRGEKPIKIDREINIDIDTKEREVRANDKTKEVKCSQ